jgi:hypothetical protein
LPVDVAQDARAFERANGDRYLSAAAILLIEAGFIEESFGACGHINSG